MNTIYLNECESLGELKNILAEMEYSYDRYDESSEEVKKNIDEILGKYEFIIASVNNYGYDENLFFLLFSREKEAFYTVYGGHCSCHGWEGQFDPTPFSLIKGHESIKEEIGECEYSKFMKKYYTELCKRENYEA